MTAMLRESVAVVVVIVVVRTRPRAIALAVVTMRKSTHMVCMGLRLAALRADGAPLLRFYTFHLRGSLIKG